LPIDDLGGGSGGDCHPGFGIYRIRLRAAPNTSVEAPDDAAARIVRISTSTRVRTQRSVPLEHMTAKIDGQDQN
jgi:hypothetical protein